MARPRLSVVVLITVVGCHGNLPPDPGDGTQPDAAEPVPPDAAETDAAPADAAPPDAAPPDYPFSDLDVGCARIFDQDIVPEYHLTITPAEWAALDDDFRHPQLTPDGNIVDPPYHPVQVHIVEGTAAHDPVNVTIKVAGNTSWLQALMFDANPKMQFKLSFNHIDPDGRFEDQRKIKLDMPRTDWTFLEQRVASAWLRGRAGIPGTCANNAKVYINGQYYGLYINLEDQDKSFLKRVYGGDDDDGDLWKGAREISTNEDTFTWAHITQFWNVTDLGGIDGLTELDASMKEWVSEAMIGDSDGYNNGRANFYLYDHPADGKFVWLENDLDTVLDPGFLPVSTSPVFPPVPSYAPRWERDWYHYLITMNDPAGVARYVQALAVQLPRMDPAEVDSWIVAWNAQIDEAAEQDENKPFSMSDHAYAISQMRGYIPARTAYLNQWLSCRSSGGADADGDGADMCHDCNDADASVHPGAAEVCDHVDNDCDGRVDNVVGQTCSSGLTADQAHRAAFWGRVLNVKHR